MKGKVIDFTAFRASKVQDEHREVMSVDEHKGDSASAKEIFRAALYQLMKHKSVTNAFLCFGAFMNAGFGEQHAPVSARVKQLVDEADGLWMRQALDEELKRNKR